MRLAVQGYSLQTDGKVYTVGASIGLVEVTPRFANIAAVIHAADTACYSAKRSGRNRVVTYMPVDDDAVPHTA